MVHDKASAAAEQLDISQELRTRIIDGVEREAVALWRRARKSDEKRLPIEKTVALAFLGQCRGIGRPVEEIQGALARAGFGIRMESVQLTVSSEDPSGIRVVVNGCERGAKIFTSPKTVRVPIYLSDLMAGGNGGDGAVEIRVSGNGSIIDASSPYESERPDWQTVRVYAARRCFYLFKARKEATISTAEEVRRTTLETNVDGLLKRFQPSKFPITATIMDNVGCLRKVEAKFASILKEMIKDARGRAPESVAASALYLADMDVFRTLPPAEKSLAWSYIVRMGLAKGGYIGNRGLVLRSEVGYDESVVQKEDLRRIGGVVS